MGKLGERKAGFPLGGSVHHVVGHRSFRDPYSAKPYVLFYAAKRVGGGVLDFNALRLLTFAA